MSRRRSTGLALAVSLIAATLIGTSVVLLAAPWGTPSPAGPSSPTAPAETRRPQPIVAPAPWSSIRWRIVPEPFPAGDPEPREVRGLTTGNGLLLGWGRVATPGRNQFDSMGAVFVSRDGLAWRSVAVDDRVGRDDGSEIYAVAAGPLGFLASGGVCCAVEQRALWWSPDGLRWTRVPLDAAVAGPDTWFNRVVGTKTGWAAVGTAGLSG